MADVSILCLGHDCFHCYYHSKLHRQQNKEFLNHDVMHVKFTHDVVLGRNLEILLLLKPGRDRSVTAAKVSNTS